ncbi:uncharacterized protein LOC129788545 [Lutzomyia longipalpis]|uniref:uncharacterized protein LOC129788545 n=1 Tax=Lutzomyia longipalpis TaxID=7200 RepID=UPI0024838D9A|nr:uncharacterized protein LOC129788545 [Lutzomyia longipalpis]
MIKRDRVRFVFVIFFMEGARKSPNLMSSGPPGQSPGSTNRKRGGSRFKKFITNPDPVDELGVVGSSRARDDYVEYETAWNYTPRGRGRSRHDVRNPWNLPETSRRPSRDRSRSLERRRREKEERRSGRSMSRSVGKDDIRDCGNGYERDKIPPEDDWDKCPDDGLGNLPSNHNLKPLKVIPEFQLSAPPIRDALVDSSQVHHPKIEPPWREEEVSNSADESTLVMVVTDESSPNKQLSNEHVKIVRKKLTRKLMKAITDGTGVQFEAHTYDGKYLKFTCANQETCDWLKSAVLSLSKLWEGASLVAMMEKDLPTYARVTAFIPGKDITQETCQTALAAQNPQLGIAKWMIWEFVEDKEAKGFNAVFGVPEEFIPKIKSAKDKAYYMFSRITLNHEQDK